MEKVEKFISAYRLKKYCLDGLAGYRGAWASYGVRPAFLIA